MFARAPVHATCRGQRAMSKSGLELMRRSRWVIRLGATTCLLCYGACHRPNTRREESRSGLISALAGATLVAKVPEREAAEWPMSGGDYSGTRFTALDEITPANVKRLSLAWRFDTDVARGHEAAPIVVGDSLYVTTPFPNRVHAFDLSRPGAP